MNKSPHSHTSSLGAELQQAYRAALYQVFTAEGAIHTLRAGQHNAWLQQALRERQADCACYLTACNPLGKLLGDAENAQRMRELRATLQSQGWQFEDGKGLDPEGLWPGEDSVLIWGMDQRVARQWGQQWQQNALLWCGPDGAPQLLWLR
ncbi:DUF3293 domain-containing protein [Comamonas testosteroni]|uniref:DUF3293 domain-containing protein n=1 Tax=Comamonas testosteroni TaxID=285 RepID=A0A373FBS1_COMTE|nr:DUF3293 domain-containing protein [Comamonas testosteroni]RGE41613.1 DUF3293 domain-containing protein [Comamonas testosteroni]